MRHKVVFCWSGGKDSALALDQVLRDGRYEVVSLLTTCNRHFGRVSMHGVRVELLDAQAAAIGLPVDKVFVSEHGGNDEYEHAMAACLTAHRDRGVTACAFGDIFLEDLRRYREANLARVGLGALFPIWKRDTRQVVRDFLAHGFAATVCCVSAAYLGREAVGRGLDEAFLASLPRDVDPCGENGEFHSFAHAGPIFRQPIRFTVGDVVYRPVEPVLTTAGPTRPTRGFWYCDLAPA
jgi:uncharacterized protein (TIGR00290 family)